MPVPRFENSLCHPHLSVTSRVGLRQARKVAGVLPVAREGEEVVNVVESERTEDKSFGAQFHHGSTSLPPTPLEGDRNARGLPARRDPGYGGEGRPRGASLASPCHATNARS